MTNQMQAILINLFVDTYIRLNYNETECNTFITIIRGIHYEEII